MIRWLFSKTYREAKAMRNHVYRLLCAQRDLMSPAAIQIVSGALTELQTAIKHPNVKKSELQKKMGTLDEVVNKWLKPYPQPVWRENVEVLLVAIAVAMGIRTFFLQPFKIPTGSMQPTLYGVNSANLLEDEKFQIPIGLERVKEWFEGISYIHVVAKNDGDLQPLPSGAMFQNGQPAVVEPPVKFLIFNIMQSFSIGDQRYTIWFPPDLGELPMQFRAGLQAGHSYHKGDDVIKLEVRAGDHLFVDRLTYNFRKPDRGDIVVFETEGIPEEERDNFNIPPDEFYIKRLVGLGGETISLKQDYIVTGAPQFSGQDVPVGHLVVNGNELSTSTPHFANLYSYPDVPAGTKTIKYQDEHYFGHAMIKNLAPGQQFQIPPGHLFVMGDNTMNSLDSRFWGDFPEQYVIGKAFFVYWPLTKRFGFGNE
jgi:signal peptidase I